MRKATGIWSFSGSLIAFISAALAEGALKPSVVSARQAQTNHLVSFRTVRAWIFAFMKRTLSQSWVGSNDNNHQISAISLFLRFESFRIAPM
jgi:hypothetical protein